MIKKLTITTLIFFSILFTGNSQTGQTNVTDSLALVDLYNSTNGPGWVNNTNWLSGPVFTWYGITVTNGSVTYIFLQSNQLSGNLPASIGNLSQLTWIDTTRKSTCR